ncbi:signal recognition particle subunit srp68 [Malassezia sp. CBS 17886]|nr:signal recognition particle subunit srp68 [Malassezia sp. CBS 17886]
MNVSTEGRSLPAGVGDVTFPVLQLVNEARSEHGMRQHDWMRYRKYCVAKTQRVRAALRLTHTDEAPGARSARGSARRAHKRRAPVTPAVQSREDKGKENVFVRKEIALDRVDSVRPLELLLFDTEHCWAAAEEIWAQQTAPDAARSALRRRSVARGRRAVQCVARLEHLAHAMGAHLDVYSRAQCAAYGALVRAAVFFIKGAWVDTRRFCAVARMLLVTLAECNASSRDEALASSFLDALDAQIRFASYSLGDTQNDMQLVAERVATPETCEAAVPGFAVLTAALRAARATDRAAQPLQLQWRGRAIPVHSTDLHDAVQKVRAEEQQLHQVLDATDAPAADVACPHAPRAKLSHAQRNAKRSGAAPATWQSRANASRAELGPFDRVLAALTDAEALARELVEENAAALQKSHSTRYAAAGGDLRRAHEYLLYRLLCVRITRNVRLLGEVQAKAHKRDARAAALLAARGAASAADVPTAQPSRKRSQPGSRARRPRTQPKAFRRRPARSGTHRVHARAKQRAAQHARDVAASKGVRRHVRVIPGLARLLESIDSSLLALGGLAMVEGEPDVSSLVEAKRFAYCAELLAHIADAFLLHGLCAEALLLLQRGDLYVRQAAQALELAEGAEQEDLAFPPQLLGVPTPLRDPAVLLRSVRSRVAPALRTPHDSASSAWRDTKAGQTLFYYAQRHVSFDADDLDHALAQLERGGLGNTRGAEDMDEGGEEGVDALAGDGGERGQADLGGKEGGGEGGMGAERSVAADPLQPTSTAHAYDPANVLAEEEERMLAEHHAAARPRSGWLSWLGR